MLQSYKFVIASEFGIYMQIWFKQYQPIILAKSI